MHVGVGKKPPSEVLPNYSRHAQLCHSTDVDCMIAGCKEEPAFIAPNENLPIQQVSSVKYVRCFIDSVF